MACVSEGEDVVIPGRLFDGDADDVGIAARLAKRLIRWSSPNATKLEVIRPGTFTAQFIRSTGLKTPVLIKGDRFNENPQMGLIWPDVHSISVDTLSDYIGSERKVDTWDVIKQRPGPAWTLSQWCTYWHARQDAAKRMAKPQTAQPAKAGFGGFDDEDDDEGEVVDSGVVIVLQGAGSRHHNPYAAARASGISPEQAQRLLDGECLPLHGSNLTQHIHPPPAIQSVDLVRPVEREMARMPGIPGSVERETAGTAAAAAAAANSAARDWGEHEVRRGPMLEIKPADTLHLQMTPKDCFTDFRLAPGGAATWLYVLLGSKVVVLYPPTAKNRRLYLTWCAATRANQTKENMVVECFLADYAEGAVKVEVKASQALAIPSGWFFATATPQDCIAVGCFFWHAYALGDTARAQQMELDLKLRPARFMLPARQLLWYAGAYYAKQLRDRLGLQPALHLRRPAGAGGGARRSASEASLNQQQRRSPYLQGLPGSGAVPLRGTSSTGGQLQQQGRQGGGMTPPLLGLQQLQYEGSSGAVLGSPMVRGGTKRGRGEMDALYLGESAVPLGGEPAAAAAAAAGAPKRLKININRKQPVTPVAGSAAAGAGMYSQQQQLGVLPSHSGMSTPRHAAAGAAAAAAGPSSSNHSDGRVQQQQQQHDLQPGGSAAVQRRQQYQCQNSPQQQRRAGYVPAGRGARYVSNVVNDDDEEGECHTSPVRRPDPEPLLDDDMAAVGSTPGYDHQWGSQQQQQQQSQRTAAAAGANGNAAKSLAGVSTLKIKVPGRTAPMYSPVIQAMAGDLDSIPALTGQQTAAAAPAATTPPAAAAERQGVVSRGLSPAAATLGNPGAAAAMVGVPAGTATPGRLKLTLKGQATPRAAAAATAAAAVATTFRGASNDAAAAAAVAEEGSGEQQHQQRKSPDSSSAGSHAVSAAQTNTGSDKQQQVAPAAAAAGWQRRSQLDPAAEEVEQQQQQLLNGCAAAAATAASGALAQPALLQQQQLQQQQVLTLPVMRRPSDGAPPAPKPHTPAGAGAAAAGAGAAAKPGGLKLKFKMSSPSPKLTALNAPLLGLGVPPALSLDAPPAAAAAAAAVANTQQQAYTQQQQQLVIPQVDGAGDALHPVQACSSSCGVDGSYQAMHDVILQGQHAMRALLSRQQQQHGWSQAVLWNQWQQLQDGNRQQQQQQDMQYSGQYNVPQVDGAGDDCRQAHVSGPTLVMQPAPAAVTPAAAAGGSAVGSQQQQPPPSVHGSSSSIGNPRSPRGSADYNAAAAAAVGHAGIASGGVAQDAAGRLVTSTCPVSSSSPTGFLSPGRASAASRLAAAAAVGAGVSVGSAAAAAGGAGLPAATDVLLPLQQMPHTSARPPVAKQQQQGGVLGSTAAAAAVQGSSVEVSAVPAAVKPNPMLQPQVQKLKNAAGVAATATTAAARGGSSSPNSPRPRTSWAPIAAAAATAAAAAPCDNVPQQQLGHGDSPRCSLPAVPSFNCWAGQDVETAAAAAAVQTAAQDEPAMQHVQAAVPSQAVAAVAAKEKAAAELAAAAARAAQQQQQQPPEADLTAAAAEAGWGGIISRLGSNCLASPTPTSVAAAAAAGGVGASATIPAAAAAGMTPKSAVLRRPSIVGDSSDPMSGTVAVQPQQQQQQPAAMLPPPPTKLSAWEVAEVPILLEFLQEQYADKVDLPEYIQDPEWVLLQFREAVDVAHWREQEEAQHRAATAKLASSQQRQQQQPQQGLELAPAPPAAGVMVMAAAEAAAAATAAAATSWTSSCGPLIVTALAPDEMPAGFAEHCNAAQALLRSSGIVTATTGHEETTEVVGETGFFEQTTSAGTGSWDNRSAGSIGGSRGAAAAAAAGVASAAAGRGVGPGQSKGLLKRGANQLATAGAAQAKKANQNKVLKGIGLSAKKR